MKAARLRLARTPSLHDLEGATSAYLPAGLLHELRSLPGTRLRWLPLTLVFWAFLQMVLNPGSSCRETQRCLQAWWHRQGRLWRNPNTNAFCQARVRLPLHWLRRLWWRLADSLARRAAPLPGTHGRRVLAVDGTSVHTPDSDSNQHRWPQPSSQKPGCGFPLIMIVGVFCLQSGALLRAAQGAWKTHEARLFALLRRTLKKGDILVADRGYWSFANLALLPLRGVDLIVRARYAHRLDWRKGRRLGPGDRLVSMLRSVDPSRVMSSRLWKRLPGIITVRQVRAVIKRKGHRPETIVLTTTLLDPVQWPAETLFRLYLRRWRIELNFDDIKTTMQAETLRCKSPEMILRELHLHAIAYNLVRALMAASATSAGADIDRISFKGTMDTLRQWHAHIAATPPGRRRTQALNDMLDLCGLDLVPDRPGRSEPRCIKKRPKPYQYLTRPRKLMRVSPSRRLK
jgi:hypothetical protein